MLTYKAMYKFLDQGVHAEVLDFPGTITQMLASVNILTGGEHEQGAGQKRLGF